MKNASKWKLKSLYYQGMCFDKDTISKYHPNTDKLCTDNILKLNLNIFLCTNEDVIHRNTNFNNIVKDLIPIESFFDMLAIAHQYINIDLTFMREELFFKPITHGDIQYMSWGQDGLNRLNKMYELLKIYDIEKSRIINTDAPIRPFIHLGTEARKVEIDKVKTEKRTRVQLDDYDISRLLPQLVKDTWRFITRSDNPNHHIKALVSNKDATTLPSIHELEQLIKATKIGNIQFNDFKHQFKRQLCKVLYGFLNKEVNQLNDNRKFQIIYTVLAVNLLLNKEDYGIQKTLKQQDAYIRKYLFPSSRENKNNSFPKFNLFEL